LTDGDVRALAAAGVLRVSREGRANQLYDNDDLGALDLEHLPELLMTETARLPCIPLAKVTVFERLEPYSDQAAREVTTAA
jgi:hypothetical protein